jgi:alkylated DNA repair dioxygenase AlkB
MRTLGTHSRTRAAAPAQGELFGPRDRDPPTGTPWPQGFAHRPELLSAREEQALVGQLSGLAFAPFEFHGYLGKRRVVSYGWGYDFGARALRRAEALPDFLAPAREQAAHFAGIDPLALEQASVIEYPPGATIGWHRDKAVFGEVVGVSLRSASVFRFRRAAIDGDGWERVSLELAPRSAYVLRGPARTEWEHSLRPVEALRYALTFRTLARR